VSETELKRLHSIIKRARSQRNATTNNEDFDYWHGIMEYHLEKLGVLLKTGETNATRN
jgi:hypothetical protein